jgi:hypothetical protein
MTRKGLLKFRIENTGVDNQPPQMICSTTIARVQDGTQSIPRDSSN